MSDSRGPSAVSLGSSILLLATGGWALLTGGAVILFRGWVASQVPLGGGAVATLGALTSLIGLAVLFWGYRLGSKSLRREVPR